MSESPKRMPDKPGLWEDRAGGIWLVGSDLHSHGRTMCWIGMRLSDMHIYWSTDAEPPAKVENFSSWAPFKPARDIGDPVEFPEDVETTRSQRKAFTRENLFLACVEWYFNHSKTVKPKQMADFIYDNYGTRWNSGRPGGKEY